MHRHRQLSLPLRRCRVIAGCLPQGVLTLRMEPEARAGGARGAQVTLSGGEPDELARLCRDVDAAFRRVYAAAGIAAPAPPRAPLAPAHANGGKRPLGRSPGKASPARSKAARDENSGGQHAAAAPSSGGVAPAADAAPLSACQRAAVALVAAKRNVFITGAAGTGKSHVLRRALADAPCRRGATFLTAPTGLAACELGAGAMTVNAFAGVGRGEGSAEELLLVRLLSTALAAGCLLACAAARQRDLPYCLSARADGAAQPRRGGAVAVRVAARDRRGVDAGGAPVRRAGLHRARGAWIKDELAYAECAESSD